MIKLTEDREITLSTWVSPDDLQVTGSTAGEHSALRKLKLDETHRVLSQAVP
jgi:hypothetical protein